MLFTGKEDSDFRKIYFDVVKYKLTRGSLELEGLDEDYAQAVHSVKVYNQLEAIKYIFENYGEGELSHIDFTNLLSAIADKLTSGEITEFRRTHAIVNGSNVVRTAPEMIRNDLWYLIDDYNYQIKNCKTEREIFEVEAQFHIRLLHIHPFEDCNGRTSRIFLFYNMCKNNLAPVIITNEVKEQYCLLIENGDYKGLADLFEKLSKKELEVMVALYRELDEKGLINTNKMNEEQEVEYNNINKNK